MGKSSGLRQSKAANHLYAIGIGSNQPLSRRLTPHRIVAVAILALDEKPLRVKAVAPVVTSAPSVPVSATMPTARVIIRTRLTPPELLNHLQAIEARFGRRRARRWARGRSTSTFCCGKAAATAMLG